MSLRPRDIPRATVLALSRGERETKNLAEALALNDHTLLLAAFPTLPPRDADALKLAKKNNLGVTRRMALAATILFNAAGDRDAAQRDLFRRAASHPSDTVRGWACYLVALAPGLSLAERLRRIRPLADDPHFGVREWAWMALRPHIATEIDADMGAHMPARIDADASGTGRGTRGPGETGATLAMLTPWTAEPSPFLRRYAVEITRPRGVWCAHLRPLRADPRPALPILEPLRADPEKYVQDSVANWLNDAAKDHPDWVRTLTARWNHESPAPATKRITTRAQRSLR